jgi:hypothetical protein
MRQLRVSLIAAVSLLSLALQIAPHEANAAIPAAFVFTPPSTSPPFPDTVIGILKPVASGSLVTGPSASHRGHANAAISAMLRASDVDLAKIIVSKGLRTAGTNLDRSTLSDARKAKMVLLLDPQVHLDLTLARPDSASGRVTATVTGLVTLAFRDPDSRATVWRKQIQIAAFTRPERESKSSSRGLDRAATNDLLHALYPVMMHQIWEQLNPVEFRVLAIKMVPD